MTKIFPSDVSWSTWTLTRVAAPEDKWIEISGKQWDSATWDVDNWEDETVLTGTAESADLDLGALDVAYVISWTGAGKNGRQAQVQYKTADSLAGLLSATYTPIGNGIAIQLPERKRFIKLFVTLLREYYADSKPLVTLTVITAPKSTQMLYDNAGRNYSPDGSKQTRDGVFSGRKYQCGICGMAYRRRDMIRQRGKMVCKETCWDVREGKRSDAQKRGK